MNTETVSTTAQNLEAARAAAAHAEALYLRDEIPFAEHEAARAKVTAARVAHEAALRELAEEKARHAAEIAKARATQAAEAEAAERVRREAPDRKRWLELRAVVATRSLSSADLTLAVRGANLIEEAAANELGNRSVRELAAREIEAICSRLGETPDRAERVEPLVTFASLGASRIPAMVKTARAVGASRERVRKAFENDPLVDEVLFALRDAGGPDLTPRAPTEEQARELAEARATIARLQTDAERVRAETVTLSRTPPTSLSLERLRDVQATAHALNRERHAAEQAEAAIVARLHDQNVDTEGMRP